MNYQEKHDQVTFERILKIQRKYIIIEIARYCNRIILHNISDFFTIEIKLHINYIRDCNVARSSQLLSLIIRLVIDGKVILPRFSIHLYLKSIPLYKI